MTHEELLEMPPDCLDTATIYEVLLWIKGMGSARAQRALYTAGIPEYTQVGALIVTQRARLIEVLKRPGSRPFVGGDA